MEIVCGPQTAIDSGMVTVGRGRTVTPAGPVQGNVTPTAAVEALSVTVPPAQAGPSFDAVTESAGQFTVVLAVPLIVPLPVSVAVIVCAPSVVNVTENVFVPLSPPTNV